MSKNILGKKVVDSISGKSGTCVAIRKNAAGTVFADIEFEGVRIGDTLTLPAGRITMADGSEAVLPEMPACTSLLGAAVKDRLGNFRVGICQSIIMSAYDAPRAEVEYSELGDQIVRYYTVYADRLELCVMWDLDYTDVF